MTSSVDPTNERGTVLTRLRALERVVNGLPFGRVYEGVDQGTKLPIDGYGDKVPYRDMEPGSTIPAARGRMLSVHEQAQPHIWAFQVHHVASSRGVAVDLATETDRALIGWQPTENAGPISGFFFQVYDNTSKNGERVQWIATRFYETQLGQSPDLTIAPGEVPPLDGGYGVGGYGS